MRKGEITDAPLLCSRSRSRSRSEAGDANAEDVTSELEEAYPLLEKLSRLSGVVGALGEDAAELPAEFLNMCRRESLPLNRPAVKDVEVDAVTEEASASVPADRGLCNDDDENEGHPEDLPGCCCVAKLWL